MSAEQVVIVALPPNDFLELQRLAAHLGSTPDAVATLIIVQCLPPPAARRRDLQRTTAGPEAR